MIITRHAEKRLKRRFGANKASIEGICRKALEEGIGHDQAKGKLKKYFEMLYHKNLTATNTRIYSQFVFIFTGNRLITAFPLPYKYHKYLT